MGYMVLSLYKVFLFGSALWKSGRGCRVVFGFQAFFVKLSHFSV